MGRQQQHKRDTEVDKFAHVRVENSTEGGACLVAHESRRRTSGAKTLYESSCNYRWQAFKRALDTDGARYNGKGLGRDHDVTADGVNFRTLCRVPYWHEAHHIIPNSELKNALETMVKGDDQAETYRRLCREGLYDEKYNLNHMVNMIILPMDETVSTKLGLPRHRSDPRVFSHREYSNKVRAKLKKLLKPVKKDESEHAVPPDYETLRDSLVELSGEMRTWIFEVGGKLSLDEAAFAEKKSKKGQV